MEAKECMKRLWILSTAVTLLISSVCFGAMAEDLAIPLIPVAESSHREGVRSDGLIPWGNGFISFDIILSSNAQGYPDGVTASISYYAKNGRTSEEVLGWDLVLNDDDNAPVHCDLWYVFPDGQQANYTNSVPVVFAESIHTCRIVPLLADDLSSDQYPAVIGSIAGFRQTSDSTTILNSGYVSRGSTRVSFQYPAACEIVDEGSIGTLVYLSESDYISLMIPKGKMSGTAAVHDYIGDFGEITELSETMNVFAVHGDENHRMPYLDVVEIGVNLPDGTGLIVCAYCPYGHTEVYDLLITVLSSITNTTVLENWLNNVWIPIVTN